MQLSVDCISASCFASNVANLGDAPVDVPAGEVILASDPLEGGAVPSDTTVWVAA